MRKESELKQLFPLQEPEMQLLCAQLQQAMQSGGVNAQTENIFGSFLVDIGTGRGLTTLSHHLGEMLLNSPCFAAEGMTMIVEVPKAALGEMITEFNIELDAAQRFGRFRGMMVIDLSEVRDPSDLKFQRYVDYIAAYNQDIIFIFRTNPRCGGQFTSVQRQLSRKLLLRGIRILEKNNEHYYKKALADLEEKQITCPLEQREKLAGIIDIVCAGITFEGFPTVSLVANEIAVCAQTIGEKLITPGLLEMYLSSEMYFSHAQKMVAEKKIGF